MSQNNQTPQFYTITAGQTLTIQAARSISVLSTGGNSFVTNSTGQTMTLGSDTSIDINADSGNTLSIVTITSTSTALVTVIGGICVITP